MVRKATVRKRRTKSDTSAVAKPALKGIAGVLSRKTAELNELAAEQALTLIRDAIASDPYNAIITRIGAGIVTARQEKEDASTGQVETLYRRIGLVGDESFQIKDVYLGKRDGLILVLKPNTNAILGIDDPDLLVETPLREAFNDFLLTGTHITLGTKLNAWAEHIGDLDSYIEAKRLAKEVEAQEIARAELHEKAKVYDTNWGAWQ